MLYPSFQPLVPSSATEFMSTVLSEVQHSLNILILSLPFTFCENGLDSQSNQKASDCLLQPATAMDEVCGTVHPTLKVL